jgi:hypothetical protein
MAQCAGSSGVWKKTNAIPSPTGIRISFTLAELRSFPHNLIELLHRLSLFVDEQLRVTHHVDEQDVCNLKMRIGFEVGGHLCANCLVALTY